MAEFVSIDSIYEYDEELEREGVWEEIQPGFEVLVKGVVDNQEFTRLRNRANRKVDAKRKRGTLTPEEAQRLDAVVLAKTVFIGFRGPSAVNKDGTPKEDTLENRIALLMNKYFFEDITALASNLEIFRKEDDEEEAKNSEGSSGTS